GGGARHGAPARPPAAREARVHGRLGGGFGTPGHGGRAGGGARRGAARHERGAWLLDADCAVSAHLDHLESRYAFRTRLLDCFWAGLPIVCTRGDELADRVERERLGEAVPV